MRDWVERGRAHPRHLQWAEYLLWVFDQAGQSIHYNEVTCLDERSVAADLVWREARRRRASLLEPASGCIVNAI